MTMELVLTPEAHSDVLAIKTILEGHASLKKHVLLIYVQDQVAEIVLIKKHE